MSDEDLGHSTRFTDDGFQRPVHSQLGGLCDRRKDLGIGSGIAQIVECTDAKANGFQLELQEDRGQK